MSNCPGATVCGRRLCGAASGTPASRKPGLHCLLLVQAVVQPGLGLPWCMAADGCMAGLYLGTAGAEAPVCGLQVTGVVLRLGHGRRPATSGGSQASDCSDCNLLQMQPLARKAQLSHRAPDMRGGFQARPPTPKSQQAGHPLKLTCMTILSDAIMAAQRFMKWALCPPCLLVLLPAQAGRRLATKALRS